MVKESDAQCRLPKWEDAVSLQHTVGKRPLLEILSHSPRYCKVILKKLILPPKFLKIVKGPKSMVSMK